MAEEFRHDPVAHRFEAWVDGEFAGEATYSLRGDVASFDHTFVKPELRHTGLAGRLVQHAFDQVREAGQWRIRPICPYVAVWVKRHPEYADLLAAGN